MQVEVCRRANCSFQHSHNNQPGNNFAPFAITTCDYVTKQSHTPHDFLTKRSTEQCNHMSNQAIH